MAAKVRLSNQAHDESTPEEDMHLPTQEEFKQAMKNLQDEEADIDWQSDVFQLKNQLGREFDASIREEASSDKSSQADTEESRRLMAKELLNREVCSDLGWKTFLITRIVPKTLPF